MSGHSFRVTRAIYIARQAAYDPKLRPMLIESSCLVANVMSCDRHDHRWAPMWNILLSHLGGLPSDVRA